MKITNFCTATAGEKLYIGDFVRITDGIATRISFVDYKEGEKRQMSASNYDENQQAIIINENTVFHIQEA